MIQVFVTGGTFDKEYNLLTGTLYFRETHLEQMFARGRCALALTIETLMMIDSVDMTRAHREKIAGACRDATCERILITHGTDTMVETARFLAESAVSGKTVVLTGAMIPYAFGWSSDGFFNLGSALAFVQALSPGVYVAMNGRVFAWDRVRKNTTTGYFEELDA